MSGTKQHSVPAGNRKASGAGTKSTDSVPDGATHENRHLSLCHPIARVPIAPCAVNAADTIYPDEALQQVRYDGAIPTERGRVNQAQICKVLKSLCLRLNAGNDNDLDRLVDVLKLHGFLPSLTDVC
jgi:hypothetical protein